MTEVFDFCDGTLDYEDAILARQDAIEIGEDDPESTYAFYVPDEYEYDDDADREAEDEAWRSEEVEHSVPLPPEQAARFRADRAVVFDPYEALMEGVAKE